MAKQQTVIQAWNRMVVVIATSILAVTHAGAEITPGVRALATSASKKLAASQTIRLRATHRLDPRLGAGAKLEKGPIEITIQRPNQFYAVQRSGEETREIVFDGRKLCLIHPGLKHHALESLKADSIEQFADRVDERFGFRPPLAELLAADLSSQVFLHVTSARVTGTEWVGLTRCKRLRFEQEGMTGDLWIGTKDSLPRRYMLTFTNVPGNPAWDIRLARWELDPQVDANLFSRRPAADSQQVKMLKSR